MQKLIQIQNKFKKINTFNSKHKMDLLNYFMSQLLQNIINDFGFYFIDSLIQKRGFFTSILNNNHKNHFQTNNNNHKLSHNQVRNNNSIMNKQNQHMSQMRKIDRQICQILGQQQFFNLNKDLSLIPQFTVDHMKNFKNLWKKLYQDYLNLINQGIIIQTLCKPLQQKINQQKSHTKLINYFKLQLYFQKIKYRKDMRQLRQSWFHQLAKQEDQARINRSKSSTKKIKLSPQS